LYHLNRGNIVVGNTPSQHSRDEVPLGFTTAIGPLLATEPLEDDALKEMEMEASDDFVIDFTMSSQELQDVLHKKQIYYRFTHISLARLYRTVRHVHCQRFLRPFLAKTRQPPLPHAIFSPLLSSFDLYQYYHHPATVVIRPDCTKSGVQLAIVTFK
jgi:hypothetical protein